MVSISIALLIALSALSGDRILQFPVGLALKHKAKAATVRVFRAVVPKKLTVPSNGGYVGGLGCANGLKQPVQCPEDLQQPPQPKMKCTEVEPNVYVCIDPTGKKREHDLREYQLAPVATESARS